MKRISTIMIASLLVMGTTAVAQSEPVPGKNGNKYVPYEERTGNEEIGIRRTDYLHFPQFRTGQEPFPLSADQCQFKELRINAVIQINQLSDLLLYGSLQTRTKLLDGILYLGKGSPGRHSHVNSVLLCTESEAPCPGIDPDKQRTKLFIFYNAVYCHKSKPLP